ncbi:MAG: hypothetical protein WBC55_05495, partial [Dehalococcoidia bacterium]
MNRQRSICPPTHHGCEAGIKQEEGNFTLTLSLSSPESSPSKKDRQGRGGKSSLPSREGVRGRGNTNCLW